MKKHMSNNLERDKKIAKLKKDGLTYKEIAGMFGLSMSRVWDIVLTQERRERWEQMENRILNIVITHYNEPWFICKKLFLSLEMQRIVNWNEINVTVVNDGGLHISEEELKQLSFPVRQIDIPKGGVSAARNAGIDHAREPWIMFCDCDDSFTSIYALDEILSAVRRSKADVLWAKILTEFGRLVVPISDGSMFAFVHGKVYRKQFLIDENLRFNEGMVFSEDTLFNDQVRERTDDIQEIRCSYQPYVWIRRGGSVTTTERSVL